MSHASAGVLYLSGFGSIAAVIRGEKTQMSTRNTGLRLKVLGTRGSMATNREDQAIFGTATSCYMVRAGEETVFLDAGNGLLTAPVDFPRPPHILLSHLHLDHLLGLGMYPRLAKKGLETTIHVPAPRGKDPAKILERVYSPPFWPVSLASYAGDVRILPLSFPFQIGEVTVEGIPGNHPGNSFIIKLSWRGKSIVYASDYEYEETSFLRLIKFAEDADLVLYDGQYTSDELDDHRGFGHSTAEHALELLDRCRARFMWLIHHDPQRSDEELQAMAARLNSKDVYFTREGDEIVL